MNKKTISQDIAIGAQPSSLDLKELQQQGFRSVVNLRRPDENADPNPEAEGEKARELGLAYFHLPVNPQNLTPAEIEEFSARMDELPKPVYVHCQGGTRAGAFCLMHLGQKKGWTGEQAFAEGEKAGYKCDSDNLRRFVRETLG